MQSGSTRTPSATGGPTRTFLVRALAAVAAAGLLHLAFAEALLGPLIAAPPTSALRSTTALVIALTTLVALVTAVLVTSRRGPVAAARATPPVLGILPPLASLALAPRLAEATPSWDQLLLLGVPVLASSTAVGLALALALERGLSSIAVSGPWLSEHPPDDDRPPGLAFKLARLVGGLGLASTLLIVSHALVGGSQPELATTEVRSIGVLVGLMFSLLLVVLAGASTGLSPGRDVRALAERLDAFGWDDAPRARSIASPVRITSFDAVGELFGSLELLRARLAEDAANYQRALDRTREADTAKAEFLAAVSHELRTPLNSILGFAQLLLESKLNEAQAEDVRLILAGGRQLLELLEDILDLSLIESGELELRPATTDLGALISELVDIHQGQARERALELRAELPAGRRESALPAVVCDRRRIGQVLTNLLSNAIKFTERGSVKVIAKHDQIRHNVEIAVHDTGVGIAADELDGVFEEYRQAGSRKRRVRGTGLGLAIARRIAEAHGGSLSVSSQLGVGSVFTLTLPEAPTPPSRDTISGEELAALRETGLGAAWKHRTETSASDQGADPR